MMEKSIRQIYIRKLDYSFYLLSLFEFLLSKLNVCLNICEIFCFQIQTFNNIILLTSHHNHHEQVLMYSMVKKVDE